jgi:tetratricopeptide (TPR) repeat protein
MRIEVGLGSVVAGYRLHERIGVGATSEVYRADDQRLGRPAALKLLATTGEREEFYERFLRESRLAAILQHPNIVPVYDAGEEGELLYIAMAYVAGTDLRALLRDEGPLPLGRALWLLGQVGDALDAAHEHGLVHRDVKPANILVAPDDHVFLTDFGAVKEVSAPALTETGGFLGTVDYAAPEQIEGSAVDARTDVYGLACVLWECLTGKPPFRRATDVSTIYAHLHDRPPRLRHSRPDLPAAVETALERGLARSPGDRFASCGELVAAVRTASRAARVDGRRLAAAAAIVAATALAGAAAGFAIGRGTHGGSTVTETQVAPRSTAPAFAAHDLDAAAYALMSDGDDARALPFARAAVRALAGRGPADPYEGYANFNLGRILLHLGRCREAVKYLGRSLALQPTSTTTAGDLARARQCARTS